MAIRKFDPDNMPWSCSFICYGQPASKSNRRRFTKIDGKPRFVKSREANTFVRDFTLQCPLLDPLLVDDIVVAIEIYYGSRRPDLDEGIILDAMQGRIYKNDRQVKEKHIYWNLDREHPRVEIRVAPLHLRS